MSGVSLDRRPNGQWRARFRDDAGKRVSFSTGSTSKEEAERRAGEELARRKGFAVTPPGTSAPPGQLPAGSSPTSRRGVGDALARVLQQPAPGIASPAPAAAAPALVPDAVLSASPANDVDGDVAKVRRVHQVVGKSATNLIEGILKRSCKWAGREPEDMDDDERALIAEGCSELAAEYLGKTKLTPGGKVMAGAICAGVGMYMGGTPIPKKPAPVMKLVPAGAQPTTNDNGEQPPTNDNDGGQGG